LILSSQERQKPADVLGEIRESMRYVSLKLERRIR
jgi:hypothetical protein